MDRESGGGGNAGGDGHCELVPVLGSKESSVMQGIPRYEAAVHGSSNHSLVWQRSMLMPPYVMESTHQASALPALISSSEAAAGTV